MSTDKILERFRQLKVKFPDLQDIRLKQNVMGIELILIVAGGFERPELFTGISEDLLRDLVYQHWPNLIPQGEQGAFTIRRNGIYMASANSLDEADQHLRVVASTDFEAIYTVLDANGQIQARYVSKMDGIVRRLDD